ncbi:AMP-binding protein [Arcanobacterium phocisimile]|uniref:AMP-binding protein n=1 Tax=Arcanobacterium phocisimile TaxID=1302235 RepID=A0ABX7II79_9ACTO|nr:AMP-binding protein [Arcanobacterium phocisimile]QRV02445.1 AMP-binding protein [Arcanobacterium phocisimile]
MVANSFVPLPDPQVVVCDGTEVPMILGAIRDGLAGMNRAPIFVVGPNVSPADTLHEVRQVGYPHGTGVLMRTSGSTSGTGKIVALSWESLCASAAATHAALAGPGRWLADLPVFHIAGFQTLVRSVLAGTEPLRISLAELLADPEVLKLGEPGQPTYCSVVPTQLSRIVGSPQLHDAARKLIFLVGGAATSGALLERAREAGLTVHTSYGMTETCGGCVYDGWPIGDAVVSLSERGQVSLTGSMVALGYLPTPSSNVASDADTASHTDADVAGIFPSGPAGTIRTHRTRDLGEFGPQGDLRILGRTDDAITTGGLTIIPRIVEETLERELGTTVVVIAIADDEWGQSAIAIVDIPQHELPPERQEMLRMHVKRVLGTGWQPRQILPLSTLKYSAWPQTASGKIDRRTIARQASIYFLYGNS